MFYWSYNNFASESPDECDRLALGSLVLALCPDVLDALHGSLELRVMGRRSLLVTHDLVIISPPGPRALGRHPKCLVVTISQRMIYT